jgi:hypothetical protein
MKDLSRSSKDSSSRMSGPSVNPSLKAMLGNCKEDVLTGFVIERILVDGDLLNNLNKGHTHQQ